MDCKTPQRVQPFKLLLVGRKLHMWDGGWKTQQGRENTDRPLMKNAADHLSQSLPPSPFLSPFSVSWKMLNQNFRQQSETKAVRFFCREWEPFKRVSKMVMTYKKDNQ